MTRLGDLERAVMDVLWDRSGPATVREVVDGLDGRVAREVDADQVAVGDPKL